MTTRMRRVIVESPFKAHTIEEARRNVNYARACLRDCLIRGEAPFASHLLYTQHGVLRDEIAMERQLGIEAGMAWGTAADATVVYIDFGISEGMQHGIERAEREGRAVEHRKLDGGQGGGV